MMRKNPGDCLMPKPWILALSMTFVALVGCTDPLTRSRPATPALAHNVYFALYDASPAARAELVAACYQYLQDHPGVTYFAAGQIVSEHTRDVNIRDWDVGLHVVFASKAHHDLYQKAEDHLKFIEENKANWRTVRVFDTYIE
jgi:hypothetical protein